MWVCGNTHRTDVYSSAENTITLENCFGCFGGHLLSHFSEKLLPLTTFKEVKWFDSLYRVLSHL